MGTQQLSAPVRRRSLRRRYRRWAYYEGGLSRLRVAIAVCAAAAATFAMTSLIMR